ncbi:MAG: carboxypeptidase regulatory-like domain-containing protein [Planctomycetota bacterium]
MVLALTCFVFATTCNSTTAMAADISPDQWVSVNEMGEIRGRVVVPRTNGISVAVNANVTLARSTGELVARPTQTDETGRFVIQDIQPGVYTLTIESDQYFACCAMHVLNNGVQDSLPIQIAAGEIDRSIVRSVILRYPPALESAKIVFDPSVSPLNSDRVIAGDTIRVRQTKGGLLGRLAKAGLSNPLGSARTNVLIFRDGQEIARGVTDANGDFMISPLEPGNYSVVASGPDGFGLMGLELVDHRSISDAQPIKMQDTEWVTQLEPLGNAFTMQVAPLASPMPIGSDPATLDRPVTSSAIPLRSTPVDLFSRAGNLSNGGSIGGGGGTLGGGGIGRNLGVLGGVGIAISVAVSDDEDTLTPPLPASPSMPPIPAGNAN